MSDKIHMDKNDKNKCSAMLKKIFGSNFYFVHSSFNIDSILESGKIKISTEVDEKILGGKPYGVEYAYCWIQYDDIPTRLKDNGMYSRFFISPIILLNENVIFNSSWRGYPIQTEDKTNTDINHIINEPYDNDTDVQFEKYYFSVYLNKDDSRVTRLKKLKKIKKFLSFRNDAEPERSALYSFTHEFLFPNGIDLKKYLIGMHISIANQSDNDRDKHSLHILKDKYPNVKLFGIEISDNKYFPKLMDICP
jgi:hypothetical protein